MASTSSDVVNHHGYRAKALADGKKCVQMHMIGSFPPPVHGMSVINAAMAQLCGSRLGISIYNLAGPSIARGFKYHLVRVLRVFIAVCKMAVASRGGRQAVYMSVSGGAGQVYEVIFVLLARLKRFPLTLHHHSYAYIARKTMMMRFLVALAPASTRHVVLSCGMAEKLESLYGVLPPQVISNSAFLPGQPSNVVAHRRLARLAFLSNISREKGIFDFIELVDKCRVNGILVSGLIVG